MSLHLLKSPDSLHLKSVEIHQRALARAKTFRASEADLIESLREVEDDKTYRLFELTSVYAYATKQMKLSEDIACSLIAIMRKSRKVPELTQAIRAGAITSSKARKIVSVINESNKEAWLELASSESSRVIEKAVVAECPKLATRESLRYKTPERLELTLGVSEEWAAKLNRVKDLLSQKEQKPVSTEDALMSVMTEFMERHDPIAKAARSTSKTAAAKSLPTTRNSKDSGPNEGKNQNTSDCEDSPAEPLSVPGRINFERQRIPAQILHEVHLRDQHQCAHVNSIGVRCTSRRWIDIHHLKPVARGGTNEVENLMTLCREHHLQMHVHEH